MTMRFLIMTMNLADKRIGIIINLYYPIIGGTQVHTKQLTEGLRRIGVHTSIITRKIQGYSKKDVVGGCDVYRILDYWDVSKHPCSKIYRAFKKGLWAAGSAPSYECRFDQGTPKGLREKRFIDWIVEAYSLTGIAIPLATHSILHHYDLLQFQLLSTFEMLPAFPYWLRRKKKILRLGSLKDFADIEEDKRMNRFRETVVKEFDKVVCISLAIREKLLRIGVPPDKLEEIPNGVDTDKFRPVEGENKRQLKHKLGFDGKRLVIFVARQVTIKGIELILEAILFAREKVPNIHYVHVGDAGEATPFLQKYVKENVLEDHVTFVGEKGDVLPYLQCADIYVSSSHSEGLSNAMLEALASALPLVVTDTSGSDEVVKPERNGYILRQRDARTFGDCLVDLLSDEDKRRCFAEASRVIAVRHFSFKEMLRRYVLMYSEVLGV